MSAADLPRIIKRKELLQLVPYTIQHVGRLERAGKFPKRKKIGARRVGWWLHEVLAWLDDRDDKNDELLPVGVAKETQGDAGGGELHQPEGRRG